MTFRERVERLPQRFGLAGDFDVETWINRKDVEVLAEDADRQIADERTKRVNLGIRLGQILGQAYDGVSMEEIATQLTQCHLELAERPSDRRSHR